MGTLEEYAVERLHKLEEKNESLESEVEYLRATLYATNERYENLINLLDGIDITKSEETGIIVLGAKAFSKDDANYETANELVERKKDLEQ